MLQLHASMGNLLSLFKSTAVQGKPHQKDERTVAKYDMRSNAGGGLIEGLMLHSGGLGGGIERKLT